MSREIDRLRKAVCCCLSTLVKVGAVQFKESEIEIMAAEPFFFSFVIHSASINYLSLYPVFLPVIIKRLVSSLVIYLAYELMKQLLVVVGSSTQIGSLNPSS